MLDLGKRRRQALVLIGGALGLAGCNRAEPEAQKPACQGTSVNDMCVADAAQPQLLDWPCPVGWIAEAAYQLSAEDLGHGHAAAPRICIPAAPQDCAPASMPDLPTGACVEITPSCAPGSWPDPPQSGAVIYVQAGASGDGSSAASPLGSIAAAIAASAAGGTILIAAGTYSEALVVNKSVTLRGACAQQTIVQAPSADENSSVVLVSAADVGVEALTLAGERFGISVIGNGNSARVHGVWIEQSVGAAISVHSGGAAQLTRVVANATQPQPSSGRFGWGLLVEAGGEVSAEGLWLVGSHDVGARVAGATSSLDLRNAVISQTDSRASDLSRGRGVVVWDGASLWAEQVVVEQNRDVGMFVGGNGSEANLVFVVIRTTQREERSNRFGRGLGIEPSAHVTASHLLVDGNHEMGVFVGGSGSLASFSDVVIRNTQTVPLTDEAGQGLHVIVGAQVELQRAVLVNNADAGLFIGGATLNATDLIVRDTRSRTTSQEGGEALVGIQGAAVNIERGSFDANREVSVWLDGVGTTAVLQDLVVQDTAPADFNRQGGRGLYALRGAQAQLTRSRFERNRDAAIAGTHSNTALTLTDIIVRDTQSTEDEGSLGRGLQLYEASATGARLWFDNNRSAGIFVTGRFSGNGVIVQNTQPEACALSTCIDASFGSGIQLIGGAVQLIGFQLQDNALAGMQVIHWREGTPGLNAAPTLTALAGEIAGNTIGLHVDVDNFDYDTAVVDVAFSGNGSDLSSATLPIPTLQDSMGN